jgi:hypothetical protein
VKFHAAMFNNKAVHTNFKASDNKETQRDRVWCLFVYTAIKCCDITAGSRNNGAGRNCPLLGNDSIKSFFSSE